MVNDEVTLTKHFKLACNVLLSFFSDEKRKKVVMKICCQKCILYL